MYIIYIYIYHTESVWYRFLHHSCSLVLCVCTTCHRRWRWWKRKFNLHTATHCNKLHYISCHVSVLLSLECIQQFFFIYIHVGLGGFLFSYTYVGLYGFMCLYCVSFRIDFWHFPYIGLFFIYILVGFSRIFFHIHMYGTLRIRVSVLLRAFLCVYKLAFFTVYICGTPPSNASILAMGMSKEACIYMKESYTCGKSPIYLIYKWSLTHIYIRRILQESFHCIHSLYSHIHIRIYIYAYT